MAPVRVRIAPSPTGDPHVGTAYIALFNYVFARKMGGQFILRIEDTDRTRSTVESEQMILRALRWVGLSWDEGPDVGGPYGPYRQSERSAMYKAAAQTLIDNGGAYPCFCTEARLAELKVAQKMAKQPPGYDRRCRPIPKGEAARRLAAGEPHTVRLAMPLEGVTVFEDKLRGRVEFQNAGIDDQVLLKSDGFPTYHLANIVDDHAMKISHVIRAEEWITSTPKHVQLYKAFGWEAPEWIHMPLLRNADKSKISKRKNPVSLDYYRDAGYLPEALLNFLGNQGFSIGGDREKFTLDEFIREFDWSKVSLGGPVFDLAKLTHLNGQYIRELTVPQVIERLRQWRLGDEFLQKLVPLEHQRIERLDDFIPMTSFFLTSEIDHTPVVDQLIPKGRDAAQTAKALGDLLETLDTVRPWTKEALEPACRAFSEKIGWKTKELFTSIRVAATGRTAAPPLFDTLEVLGREITRVRFRSAVRALEAKKS
jgi:glutamyl-tRNA synthetase